MHTMGYATPINQESDGTSKLNMGWTFGEGNKDPA